MAENAAPKPAETGAPMDYDEHEQTYAGFVALTRLTVIATVNVLIILAIFGFGGGGAFWIGIVLLLLTMAAAAIGIVSKAAWKYSLAVTVLAVLALILTVAT